LQRTSNFVAYKAPLHNNINSYKNRHHCLTLKLPAIGVLCLFTAHWLLPAQQNSCNLYKLLPAPWFNFKVKNLIMQLNRYIKKWLAVLVLLYAGGIATAQSVDGWYKVLTGKMGNYDAVMHLHKTNKNYSGYLWFKQLQVPMQLFYTGVKGSDSLTLTSRNGSENYLLAGIIGENSFNGVAQLFQDDATPQQAKFELQVNNDKTYTPFNYYYTEGFAKLLPQYKNPSDCQYTASVIWPAVNNSAAAIYKNEIRQSLGITTPVEEIGRWLIDAKNQYIADWRSSTTKFTPKEITGKGSALILHEELRLMVMFENERNITLADYGFAYTGRANNTSATSLYTFTKLTNKLLKLTDIFNAAGLKQLSAILEKTARLQFNIKNSKPLMQNGFTVLKIKPSTNFYITDEGVGFVYAPYAIKPLADGQINLLIPFNMLKGYLQPGLMTK